MPPPPRPRLRPHEAIREIVRTKHEFFPSSWSRRCSPRSPCFPGHARAAEHGRGRPRVAVNRNHSLRPRVEIVADGKGQRPATPDDGSRRRAVPVHHGRCGWWRPVSGLDRRRGPLMAQYEMNLRDYWLIVMRRRMIIITSTVLVALLSLGLARQKVPIYQATSAVKFEQSTQMSGLLVEVLVLERRLHRDAGDADQELPDPRGGRATAGRLPEKPAAARCASRKTTGGRSTRSTACCGSSASRTRASSRSPRSRRSHLEARDLANATAEAYRDYNKSLRNSRVTEARRFIENQLKDVETRSRRTEAEIWAFREANRIIAPGAESSVLLSRCSPRSGRHREGAPAAARARVDPAAAHAG